ncbi:hypothetical protein J2809_002557 [Arthrobacter pascens]|nr:hypothetical protein [Arthrobacter pascens]
MSESTILELLIIDEPATSPKQIVERACHEKKKSEQLARQTKDPNAAYDSVWCAFDIDEHPFIKEACQQARDNGIETAISNPCIEVWFLLHFENRTAQLHRREARRLLENYIANYDKTLVALSGMEGKYADAKKRAQLLDNKHTGDATLFPENNPSSGMWRLVDHLQITY